MNQTSFSWTVNGIANQVPGEIVSALVSNALENRNSKGKKRPCVFIAREGGLAWVLPLTGKDHYASGELRIPVPEPLELGLNRQGYLWGAELMKISVLDIVDNIGYVHPPLVDLMVEMNLLAPEEVEVLSLVAKDHHPNHAGT